MKETYIYNKDLPLIKSSWLGNLLIGKQFHNSKKNENYSIFDLLRWKLSINPQWREKRNDKFRLEVIPNKTFSNSVNDMILWFGHSSFYIRLGGKTFITDPIYYNKLCTKREAPMPCSVSDIKKVNYLLLSHNHRDHMDKCSLKELGRANPSITGLFPLRLSRDMKKYVHQYQEAGWYQEYKIDGDAKVFMMPAKHWSRRGIFDKNKSLWGSYILQFNGKTIFFAGDTAFDEDNFKEIAKLFPQIDYALLPIGAYMPQYMMKRAHMKPEEAVAAANILNAKTIIPMHFATFDLSDEPIGEPYRTIKKQKEDGILKGELRFLKVGEVFGI